MADDNNHEYAYVVEVTVLIIDPKWEGDNVIDVVGPVLDAMPGVDWMAAGSTWAAWVEREERTSYG